LLGQPEQSSLQECQASPSAEASQSSSIQAEESSSAYPEKSPLVVAEKSFSDQVPKTSPAQAEASSPEQLEESSPEEAEEPLEEAGEGIGVGKAAGADGPALAERTTGRPTASAELVDESYRPVLARPTPALRDLLFFRGVNPLYGIFLVRQLGIANRAERIQAFESLLELPRSLGPAVWVPGPEQLPPGPLASNRLDRQLVELGLATEEELYPPEEPEEPRRRRIYDEPRKRPLTLAEKLKLLFDYEHPGVHDVRITPVWVAGALLEMGGDFDNYIRSRSLETQEGIVFRHLLRLILLVNEFLQFCPPDADPEEWTKDLEEIALRLTVSCRKVDPSSTQRALEEAETDVEIEE
jgi:hypothetical protein